MLTAALTVVFIGLARDMVRRGGPLTTTTVPAEWTQAPVLDSAPVGR